MTGVLLSFWSLIALMGIGYALARYGITRPGADKALSKICFSALVPALLFNAMIQADPREVFSLVALANVLGALILAAIFVIVARAVFGMRGGEVTIGALCASYTNAGNLGIAFLTAIVGDPSQAAPIMLFQLGFMVPVSFAILDRQSGRPGMTWKRTLLGPFTNPPVIAAIVGLVVSLTGWEVPGILSQPIDMLAGAAVPMMLLAMGVSWRGASVPPLNAASLPLFFAIFLRCIGGPVVVYLLGLAFGLSHHGLLVATIAAAFPTANNVFVYAHRYNVGVPFARDAVLLSTVLSLGVATIIAALFHI